MSCLSVEAISISRKEEFFFFLLWLFFEEDASSNQLIPPIETDAEQRKTKTVS